MIRRKFEGTIIYATPGSGKTYLAENYDNIVDADDVILDTIRDMSPGFRNLVITDHPSANIGRYIRYAPSKFHRLYNNVANRLEELRDDGCTVLMGSRRLMYLADFVFIQDNERILEERGLDQDRETKILNKEILKGDLDSRNVKRMNNYLELYLIDR